MNFFDKEKTFLSSSLTDFFRSLIRDSGYYPWVITGITNQRFKKIEDNSLNNYKSFPSIISFGGHKRLMDPRKIEKKKQKKQRIGFEIEFDLSYKYHSDSYLSLRFFYDLKKTSNPTMRKWITHQYILERFGQRRQINSRVPMEFLIGTGNERDFLLFNQNKIFFGLTVINFSRTTYFQRYSEIISILPTVNQFRLTIPPNIWEKNPYIIFFRFSRFWLFLFGDKKKKNILQIFFQNCFFSLITIFAGLKITVLSTFQQPTIKKPIFPNHLGKPIQIVKENFQSNFFEKKILIQLKKPCVPSVKNIPNNLKLALFGKKKTYFPLLSMLNPSPLSDKTQLRIADSPNTRASKGRNLKHSYSLSDIDDVGVGPSQLNVAFYGDNRVSAQQKPSDIRNFVFFNEWDNPNRVYNGKKWINKMIQTFQKLQEEKTIKKKKPKIQFVPTFKTLDMLTQVKSAPIPTIYENSEFNRSAETNIDIPESSGLNRLAETNIDISESSRVNFLAETTTTKNLKKNNLLLNSEATQKKALGFKPDLKNVPSTKGKSLHDLIVNNAKLGSLPGVQVLSHPIIDTSNIQPLYADAPPIAELLDRETRLPWLFRKIRISASQNERIWLKAPKQPSSPGVLETIISRRVQKPGTENAPQFFDEVLSVQFLPRTGTIVNVNHSTVDREWKKKRKNTNSRLLKSYSTQFFKDRKLGQNLNQVVAELEKNENYICVTDFFPYPSQKKTPTPISSEQLDRLNTLNRQVSVNKISNQSQPFIIEKTTGNQIEGYKFAFNFTDPQLKSEGSLSLQAKHFSNKSKNLTKNKTQTISPTFRRLKIAETRNSDGDASNPIGLPKDNPMRLEVSPFEFSENQQSSSSDRILPLTCENISIYINKDTRRQVDQSQVQKIFKSQTDKYEQLKNIENEKNFFETNKDFCVNFHKGETIMKLENEVETLRNRIIFNVSDLKNIEKKEIISFTNKYQKEKKPVKSKTATIISTVLKDKSPRRLENAIALIANLVNPYNTTLDWSKGIYVNGLDLFFNYSDIDVGTQRTFLNAVKQFEGMLEMYVKKMYKNIYSNLQPTLNPQQSKIFGTLLVKADLDYQQRRKMDSFVKVFKAFAPISNYANYVNTLYELQPMPVFEKNGFVLDKINDEILPTAHNCVEIFSEGLSIFGVKANEEPFAIHIDHILQDRMSTPQYMIDLMGLSQDYIIKNDLSVPTLSGETLTSNDNYIPTMRIFHHLKSYVEKQESGSKKEKSITDKFTADLTNGAQKWNEYTQEALDCLQLAYNHFESFDDLYKKLETDKVINETDNASLKNDHLNLKNEKKENKKNQNETKKNQINKKKEES